MAIQPFEQRVNASFLPAGGRPMAMVRVMSVVPSRILPT